MTTRKTLIENDLIIRIREVLEAESDLRGWNATRVAEAVLQMLKEAGVKV